MKLNGLRGSILSETGKDTGMFSFSDGSEAICQTTCGFWSSSRLVATRNKSGGTDQDDTELAPISKRGVLSNNSHIPSWEAGR